MSLGVRFLLLGLGATPGPAGGGEGARAAAAAPAPCLPWIQDTLGLVAGSGGGGFRRSGDGESDRPRASSWTRAGRASRRATRAYSAPPGPSPLHADRSLSEDAGRGAASSAGVVTGAAAGTSESRLSAAASDQGRAGRSPPAGKARPSSLQAQAPAGAPSWPLPAATGAQASWHPNRPGRLPALTADLEPPGRTRGSFLGRSPTSAPPLPHRHHRHI